MALSILLQWDLLQQLQHLLLQLVILSRQQKNKQKQTKTNINKKKQIKEG